MFKLNFFRKNKNSGQIWALFGQIKPKIIESVLFTIFSRDNFIPSVFQSILIK